MKKTNKIKLTGRELDSLTPKDIEEIMEAAGIPITEVIKTDDEFAPDFESLHPVYAFHCYYDDSEDGNPNDYVVMFTVHEVDDDDESFCESAIIPGAVTCFAKKVDDEKVMDWFLNNGWQQE